MAKSRQRKDHKKKVKLRNERIKSEYKRATKLAWDKFEEMKNANQNNESIRGPINFGQKD